MKLEGYIAKQIKTGLYQPGETCRDRVLLIIETESQTHPCLLYTSPSPRDS